MNVYMGLIFTMWTRKGPFRVARFLESSPIELLREPEETETSEEAWNETTYS